MNESISRGSKRPRRTFRPSGPSVAATGSQTLGIGLFAILLVSLLFGGGGTPAEDTELIVQLSVLAIAAILVLTRDGSRLAPWRIFARDPLIAVFGLALALMIALQLVPLPPSVWNNLPGREIIASNLIIFEEQPWLPLSIAPNRTLASLLSLIPPFVAFMVASSLRPDQFSWNFRAVLVFLVLTVGLQMLQTTGGFVPYSQTQIEFTSGFQANRNAQADILIMVMAIIALRPQGVETTTGRFLFIQAILASVLVVAVLLTGSRSGLVLSLLVLPLFVLRYWRIVAPRANLRRVIIFGVAALLVVAIAGYFLSQNDMVLRTLSRFALTREGRFDIIWPDAIYTLQQFQPWGSGFGTFIPAFQLFESQEILSAQFANRAHNEYLEVLIEGGIPGALVVFGGVAAIMLRAVMGMRQRRSPQVQRLGLLLLVITALIALHSIVDYPMRSMSIAVLYASILGLFVAARSHHQRAAVAGDEA